MISFLVQLQVGGGKDDPTFAFYALPLDPEHPTLHLVPTPEEAYSFPNRMYAMNVITGDERLKGATVVEWLG